MRLKILVIFTVVALGIFAVMVGARYNKFKDLLSTIPEKIAELTQNSKKTSEDAVGVSVSLEKLLSNLYTRFEIPAESVKSTISPGDTLLTIQIDVPKGKPVENILLEFSSAIKKANYQIRDCIFISDEKGAQITAKSRNAKIPQLQVFLRPGKTFFSKTARIAILVEDFKFSADKSTIDFLSFPEPLTVSMVGEKKMSTWTAQIANEYHKEIVILLPMEPVTKSIAHYGVSAIKVHFTDATIRSLLHESKERIPNFVGFCNLSGSRVLEDTRVMNTICQEINRMNGYLVISPESRKSVAEAVARNNGLNYQKIDFSINTTQPESVLIDSLRHCALLAQKKGTLLVRGKSSPEFINALKTCRPIFHHNGIRFVYISDLFEKKDNN